MKNHKSKQFRVTYCGYYGMVFDTREKADDCVAKLTTVGLSTPEGLKPLALSDIEIIEEDTPIEIELACPRCGYSQTEGQWVAEAVYEYNGKYVAGQPLGGDHARCPHCNKLLSVNYDLIEK